MRVGKFVVEQFWAMSRDGATPNPQLWAYLTPKSRVPLYSILLTSIASVAFTIPVFWSSVAFRAINSFATISTYLAYGTPILIRATIGRKRFVPGPLSLGRWAFYVNMVALAWICGISVLFCMPTIYPVTRETLNYTPLAFAAFFVLITLPWLLPKTLFNFKGL